MSQPARTLVLRAGLEPKFVEASSDEPRALYPLGGTVSYIYDLPTYHRSGTVAGTVTNGAVFTQDCYLIVTGEQAVVEDRPSAAATTSTTVLDRAVTGRTVGSTQCPTPRAQLVDWTPAPLDLTDAADFYIDSVNGVDTNDGRTHSTPWKTLAKITTGNGVAAGSVIALKCGSEFREALPVVIAGTTGAPVVYGQYGVGTRPKIKGSKDYGSANTWTAVGGGVYSMPAASLPTSNVCYIDEDTGLKKVASTGALVAGSYFPDTGNSLLYVFLADGSSPAGRRVEVNGVTTTLCNTSTFGNLVFQDIQVMHGSGGNSGIFSANATARGIRVRRCKSGPHFGVGITADSPGMVVEDCYVYNCWDWIEYPGSAASGAGIVAATVNNVGVEIRRNRVTGCYYGIRPLSGADVTIHHNLVYLNHVNGIDNNGGATDKVRVYNNTVWHRPTSTDGHGIDQQGGADGFTGRNNLIYCDFTGSNNNSELFTLNGGTGAKTSDDYSLGYATPTCTAAPGKVGITQYTTWASYVAAAQAAYGAGNYVHSIYGSDPLFVDLANFDFALRPGSPALRAGVAVSPFTDGYTGSAPNIGAM